MRPRNSLLFTEEMFHCSDETGRQLDSVPEHPPEFLENDFAHDQFVFGKDMPENIRTQATGRERTDQHVGIQEYPHDTFREMSSSVR